MMSLCMMDNPGEWAVSQELSSTAEASDCGRTCIRSSPQKYYLRIDFQLFALWKEELSHLQLSYPAGHSFPRGEEAWSIFFLLSKVPSMSTYNYLIQINTFIMSVCSSFYVQPGNKTLVLLQIALKRSAEDKF